MHMALSARLPSGRPRRCQNGLCQSFAVIACAMPIDGVEFRMESACTGSKLLREQIRKARRSCKEFQTFSNRCSLIIDQSCLTQCNFCIIIEAATFQNSLSLRTLPYLIMLWEFKRPRISKCQIRLSRSNDGMPVSVCLSLISFLVSGVFKWTARATWG